MFSQPNSHNGSDQRGRSSYSGRLSGRSGLYDTPAKRNMYRLFDNTPAASSSASRRVREADTNSPASKPLPTNSPMSINSHEDGVDSVMHDSEYPPLSPSFDKSKSAMNGSDVDFSAANLPPLIWKKEETDSSPSTSAVTAKLEQLSLGDPPNRTTPSRPSPLAHNSDSPILNKILAGRTARSHTSSAEPKLNRKQPSTECQDTSTTSNSEEHAVASSARSEGTAQVSDLRSNDLQTASEPSAPQSASLNSNYTGVAQIELEQLLQTNGHFDSVSSLHRYKITHVEFGIGQPHKGLQRLAYEQGISKILPQGCIRIDNSTYLLGRRWIVRDDSASETGVGEVFEHVRDMVLLTSARIDEEEDGRLFTIDMMSDGKPDRMPLKLGEMKFVPATFRSVDNAVVLKKKDELLIELEDLCSPVRKDTIPIAIKFEHGMLQLDNPLSLANAYKDSTLQSKTELNAVVAHMLRRRLVEAGQDIEHIIMHRNRAYTNQIVRSLPCGVVLRAGLEGELVHKAGASPKIMHRPCKQLFYEPDQTVAEFIMAFVGQHRAHQIDSATLETMSNMMKGVEIIVAVKDTFNKAHCTVKGLAGNPISKPESLHGLKSMITIKDLKFPFLPCVDVGRSGRPFYFPSELCLIKPNQMFRGEIPKVDHLDLFSTKTLRTGNADRYRAVRHSFAVGSDDFKLLFLSITLSPTFISAKPLRAEVWNAFQYELGQRFEQRLTKAVATSKKASWEFRSVESALSSLSRIASFFKGPKSVIVVAVPPGLPKEAVGAIRSHCDRVVGAQCCFVRTLELEKRYPATSSRDLVMYTGQIARKIFGRSNIPEADNAELNQSITTSSVQKNVGRLFGIHISSLRNFRQGDGVDTAPLYFASILSVSSGEEIDLCTTYHFATLNKDPRTQQEHFSSEISSCLGQHVDKISKPEMRCSAVYVAGMPVSSSQDLTLLKTTMVQELVRKAGSRPEFNPNENTVIVVEPQTQMTVDSADGKYMLPMMNVSDEDLREFRYDYNLEHVALKRIYRRPDCFRNADGSLREPSETYCVTYQRSERKNNLCSTLEKRHLPDILHLAKAAWKRGRSYVSLKEDGETNAGCPYRVSDVHTALQGTLYYI